MITELILILTVVPTVLAGIFTAFICFCIKICDFLIWPVVDFVLKLFGM